MTLLLGHGWYVMDSGFKKKYELNIDTSQIEGINYGCWSNCLVKRICNLLAIQTISDCKSGY